MKIRVAEQLPMIDIWIIYALLVLVFVAMPFRLLNRMRPRILSGPGITLPTLEQNRADYEKGRQIRFGQWLLAVIGFIYLLLRSQAQRSFASFSEINVDLVLAILGLITASWVLAVTWGYQRDRKFIAHHPEFSDCLQPLTQRIGGVFVMFSALFVIIGALKFTDLLEILAMVLAGLVVMILGKKVYMKALIASQVEIPLDSPLGIRVAEVISSFGFTPKRFVQLRSLVANGFAMEDGTVAITTTLRVLCTDEEIGAILAHELSHAKDRDPKKIQLRRYVALTSIVIVATVTTLAQSLTLAFPPTIICGVAATGPLNAFILAKLTQPLEFKCDRDTVQHGLGAELSSGLEKITCYAGLPARWSGWDRKTLTHPDLESRQRAIASQLAQ